MSFGIQINYKQLLERHGRIRVPMIQRDFAQGRPSETEVREEFLKTLRDALCKHADDASLPLNLDFIYGSVEGDEQTRFLPLDGQQRLTTLFLLHWYLAWKDEEWASFEQLFLSEGHSRFAYSVRPSSNEFFDQLVVYRPSLSPEEVPHLADMITDQPWYFRSWRLDPTIQAVLNMLDAIHDMFGKLGGLFARLLDEESPAITFQLLDLENFGLSDDLYIKMNARGKPLTAFETFKARYEQELSNHLQNETFIIGKQSFGTADYVARRMDTSWADLFWQHRTTGRDLYDDAFMNVLRAIALITRNPDSEDFLRDSTKLRSGDNPPSFTDFHSCNWLDEQFTHTLILLLDSWSANGGKLCQLLPDNRYLDENELFDSIVSNGASLSYMDLVQLIAYAQFIVKHQGDAEPDAFQEWMRIIRNLAVNTAYNRSDDFRRSIRGIAGLLVHSDDVLLHFVDYEEPAIGFSGPQIAEEKLKAELILANGGWRALIDRAESHGYFRGQIGFLLDFAGIADKRSESKPSRWSDLDHTSYLKAFEEKLALAETMFSEKGLRHLESYLWQRALLSLGDYLLPSGRNSSFLGNTARDEASWKRLLSGTGQGQRALQARNVLKKLFCRLTLDSDISEQLQQVISEAEQLEPWREAVVNCPAVIDYCERNSIRKDDSGTIYLLKRSQMNGTHAELFTFCFYNELLTSDENCDQALAPLKLEEYYSSTETAIEPGIRFYWSGDTEKFFKLESDNDCFILYRILDRDENNPPFIDFLAGKPEFKLTEKRLERKCAYPDIRCVINDIRKHLTEFTERQNDLASR